MVLGAARVCSQRRIRLRDTAWVFQHGFPSAQHARTLRMLIKG